MVLRKDLANGYSAQISYLAPDPADGFVTVRERAAIRFRYYLLQPARLKLVMWNITKDENFEQSIHAVAGKWTTVTLFFRDIPPNAGGKKVVCEPGDRYRSISLVAGKAGDATQLLVDRLEVVEIAR